MSKAFHSLFLVLFAVALASCGGGSDPGQSSVALTAASTTAKTTPIPRFTVIDLGAINDAAEFASGINAGGDVVGSGYKDASGTYPGFLYRNGRMTGLPFTPYAINKYGTIVGSNGKAVVLEDGQLRELGTLGGNYGMASAAYAINDKGQFVGSSSGVVNGASVSHAFLYSDGRMQDLGTLGNDPVSVALAINKRGQIVGYTFDPATFKQRGFLYQNGQMIDLSPFGIDSANGINDDGVVVGSNIMYESLTGKVSTIPPYFVAHAINNKGVVAGEGFGGTGWVYQDGRRIDLNEFSIVPKPEYWVALLAAVGINDDGAVIGTARASSSEQFGNLHRAYLLVPVKQK